MREAGITVERIEPAEPTLEDVFLALAGKKARLNSPEPG